jgi:hypothetical protein
MFRVSTLILTIVVKAFDFFHDRSRAFAAIRRPNERAERSMVQVYNGALTQ